MRSRVFTFHSGCLDVYKRQLPEHAVEENGVVIAQAGTGTDQIGRFDIIVDTDGNCIDSYTWQSVPITADTCLLYTSRCV